MYYDDEDVCYADYDDEGRDYDASTYNFLEGSAQNVVQARDVHGPIIISADESDYNEYHYHDYPAGPEYFSALPWGFSVAAYGFLFVVSAAYAHVFDLPGLSIWDWLKLGVSTLLLIPVFLATEYRLHGVEFWALRILLMIVTIALGVNEGAGIVFLRGLCDLMTRWLVWRFYAA